MAKSSKAVKGNGKAVKAVKTSAKKESKAVKTTRAIEWPTYDFKAQQSDMLASYKYRMLVTDENKAIASALWPSIDFHLTGFKAVEEHKIIRVTRQKDEWAYVIGLFNNGIERKEIKLQYALEFDKKESQANSFINSIACCLNAINSKEKVGPEEKSIVKRYAAAKTGRYTGPKMIISKKERASTGYVDRVLNTLKKLA